MKVMNTPRNARSILQGDPYGSWLGNAPMRPFGSGWPGHTVANFIRRMSHHGENEIQLGGASFALIPTLVRRKTSVGNSRIPNLSQGFGPNGPRRMAARTIGKENSDGLW